MNIYQYYVHIHTFVVGRLRSADKIAAGVASMLTDLSHTDIMSRSHRRVSANYNYVQ